MGRGVLHCWTFLANFRAMEEKYGEEMAQKRMLSPYQSKHRTTQTNKEGVEQCNVPYTAWGHAFPTHGPKGCRAGYDMFANVMNPN